MSAPPMPNDSMTALDMIQSTIQQQMQAEHRASPTPPPLTPLPRNSHSPAAYRSQVSNESRRSASSDVAASPLTSRPPSAPSMPAPSPSGGVEGGAQGSRESPKPDQSSKSASVDESPQ